MINGKWNILAGTQQNRRVKEENHSWYISRLDNLKKRSNTYRRLSVLSMLPANDKVSVSAYENNFRKFFNTVTSAANVQMQ